MENLLLELQGKLEKANKKVSSLKRNVNAGISKTIYYKKKYFTVKFWINPSK